MSMLVLVAAACVFLGVLSLLWEALRTRPLSDFHRSARSRPTLEPKGQAFALLGRSETGLA